MRCLCNFLVWDRVCIKGSSVPTFSFLQLSSNCSSTSYIAPFCCTYIQNAWTLFRNCIASFGTVCLSRTNVQAGTTSHCLLPTCQWYSFFLCGRNPWWLKLRCVVSIHSDIQPHCRKALTISCRPTSHKCERDSRCRWHVQCPMQRVFLDKNIQRRNWGGIHRGWSSSELRHGWRCCHQRCREGCRSRLSSHYSTNRTWPTISISDSNPSLAFSLTLLSLDLRSWRTLRVPQIEILCRNRYKPISCSDSWCVPSDNVIGSRLRLSL